MKRWLVLAVLSLVLFSGSLAAQEAIRLRAVAQPDPKADSNREIIEMLKQVIQKLEAQGSSPGVAVRALNPHPEAAAQLENAKNRLAIVLRDVQVRTANEPAGEIQKARQELEQAQRHLQEAAEKVHRLEAGRGGAWQPMPERRIQVLERKTAERALERPRTELRREDLEQRIARMMGELEELRRELKQAHPER